MPNHYDNIIDINCRKCGKYLFTIYPDDLLDLGEDETICNDCERRANAKERRDNGGAGYSPAGNTPRP